MIKAKYYSQVRRIKKKDNLYIENERTVETGNEPQWSDREIEGRHYVSLVYPYRKDWNGRSFIGAIRFIESTKYVEQILKDMFWSRCIMFMGMVLCISSITGWVVRKRVLNPLDDLFLMAYKTSKGDWTTSEFDNPANELEDIQIMFNYMVNRFCEHENKLLSKERKSAILETSSTVYSVIVEKMIAINEICDMVNGLCSDNSSELRSLFRSIKIKCKNALDELSKITDLLDENLEVERIEPASRIKEE